MIGIHPTNAMYYADYKKFDVLNGEGYRFSLFVSGCNHGCPGCFNKVAQCYKYGKLFDKVIEDQIISDLNIDYIPIDGLSLLGGCPFCNAKELIPFILRVKKECPQATIWAWAGETYEEMKANPDKWTLFTLCDVVIDGLFVEELKDLRLFWRGSSNQRVIDVKKSVEMNQPILYAPAYINE